MAKSVEQFAKSVVAAGLATAEEIKSWWGTIAAHDRPGDGSTFAQRLVQLEKLTEFQAAELLSGSETPLVLGDYVLLGKIGAGGMGQVFKARHRRMKRLVAIKLLPSAMTKDDDAIKRFEREVEAAAKLSHPNIVQAYDASVQRGVWYLAMEYVEGRDLAGVVSKEGPLPVSVAVDYICQAARGLGYAHENGVVHRDIKPANLLLDKKGVVKILDMGLARIDDAAGQAAQQGLTQSGQVMGTVDYMAPEQAYNVRHVDGRADIYSLGCTLYRLLTGRNMYAGESLVEKLMAHQTKPIPSLVALRPDVPQALEDIYARMVAKSPDDRFPSMAEVEAALAELLSPAPQASASTFPDSGSKLNAFFQTIAGPKTQSKPVPTSAALPNPLSSSDPATPTISLRQGQQGTDPVSDRSIQLARADSDRILRSRKRSKLIMLAAAASGVLVLVSLAIWGMWRPNKHQEYVEVTPPVAVPSPAAAPTSAPNYALLFNGSSTGVTIENPPAYNPTSLTIEAYVRVDRAVPRGVVYQLGGNQGLGLDLSEGNKWRISQLIEPSGHFSAETKSPIAFGERMHVAGVCAGERFTLYVNGKLAATSPRGSRTFKLGTGPHRIGSGFYGTIDEVHISKVPRYDRDFAPPRRFEDDAQTLALYHCDEGQGELLIDSSGHGHHGKLVGAQWVKTDRGSEISNFESQIPNLSSPYDILTSPDYEWSKPENLGPPINSIGGASSPFLAADGLTLYFERGRPEKSGLKCLWSSERASLTAAWGEPKQLDAAIHGPKNEQAATLSADGLTLVFASDRDRQTGKYQLWQATRKSTGDPWPAPQIVPALTSPSDRFDDGPELSADGLTLWFHSSRAGSVGGEDLYLSRRASPAAAWGPPENLGAVVNSTARDFAAAVSSDSRVLVFSSDRAGGAGRPDLWWSQRSSPTAVWSAPQNMGPPINTQFDDLGATLSAGGQTMYFRSNRPGGVGTGEWPEVWMSRRVQRNGQGITPAK